MKLAEIVEGVFSEVMGGPPEILVKEFMCALKRIGLDQDMQREIPEIRICEFRGAWRLLLPGILKTVDYETTAAMAIYNELRFKNEPR